MRSSFSQRLSSLDQFGQPIELNFKGRSSFNTTCGGFITLLVNTLVAMLTYSLLVKLISQEEMKIQTYNVGSIPPEGQYNFLRNKIQFSFFIKGFPGYIIDPRAGRLVVALQSKENFGIKRHSEFLPLEKCDGDFIESQIDYIQTTSLNLWNKSLCLPSEIYAQGLQQQVGSISPVVRLIKCN